MKRVRFEVKNHEDRVKIYEVLAKNGYSVDIKTETSLKENVLTTIRSVTNSFSKHHLKSVMPVAT